MPVPDTINTPSKNQEIIPTGETNGANKINTAHNNFQYEYDSDSQDRYRGQVQF